MKGVSMALNRLLLMGENKTKNEESYNNMTPRHTSHTHSPGENDCLCSYDSGDIRRLVDPQIRPSPSQESEFEEENPYPGIDLNEGWNRATLQGLRGRYAARPSISDNKIRSDFAGFSLRAQQLLLPVGQDLEKYFTFVFRTTGLVNKPFHTCRSLVLSQRTLQPMNCSTWPHPQSYNLAGLVANMLGQRAVDPFDLSPETMSKIRRCLSHHTPMASRGVHKRRRSRKRRCLRLGGQHIYHQNPHLAPLRGCSSRSKDNHNSNRLVLADAWRKRMRSRAMRQGRWTDGTARQDRLWALFHWVLDGDVGGNPREQRRAFSFDVVLEERGGFHYEWPSGR